MLLHTVTLNKISRKLRWREENVSFVAQGHNLTQISFHLHKDTLTPFLMNINILNDKGKICFMGLQTGNVSVLLFQKWRRKKVPVILFTAGSPLLYTCHRNTFLTLQKKRSYGINFPRCFNPQPWKCLRHIGPFHCLYTFPISTSNKTFFLWNFDDTVISLPSDASSYFLFVCVCFCSCFCLSFFSFLCLPKWCKWRNKF